MKHISDPLKTLHDDCAWFVRAREVRLLVVRTSSDLRKTIVKLLPRYEFLADNRSPWVLIEDPYTADAPLWESRAARLLQNWEARREAFAREGTELPAAVPSLSPDSTQKIERTSVTRFLEASVAVLQALREPLSGIVVVLAPAIVEDVQALDSDLAALFGRPEFEKCRLVVVLDHDLGPLQRTVEQLGDAHLTCACVTDPLQKKRDLHALIGTASHDAASTIGASPAGVTPPRRRNSPPAPDPKVRDAMLREAGIEPAYLEHAPALRRLILGAAMAMGEGRSDEAIAMQTEAVQLCEQVAMPQLLTLCQITLANYLAAAGDRAQALQQLAVAQSKAAEHGLPDQESQALLAQGLLYNLDQRHVEAATAYRACAMIAEASNAEILAIEAWRLAGQAALQAGEIPLGAQYLKHALHVAGGLDASIRSMTSAPEVARRLATMYAERGYSSHADALHAQADAIERGAPLDSEAVASGTERA